NVAAIAARPGDALAIDPAEFDADDSDADPGELALAPDQLPPGADAGLFLHDVLEVADVAAAWRAPDGEAWRDEPGVVALLTDKARGRGISLACLPHAADLIHRALTATRALIDGGLLPALAEAEAFAREVEFGYPLPALPGEPPRGLVKGFIDALVAWNGELWVVDYKSDLLVGDDLAAAAQRRVREKYAVQARLYAIAADRMRGHRKLAGLLFMFIRHDVTVPVRISDSTLATWTDWLAQIAATSAIHTPDLAAASPERRT
ncbi:MAG TPA: PD-(D/E)XK nuclease family protein, partial [Kofleriaceae bacterium]|nr:PD-(D/E)XK nuclease family protein [Kofleriaceae bacterium]